MKLVLFDCDGTLLDSQHVIVSAISEAFEAHGFERPARERTLSIVGLSVPEAVGALLPEADGATVQAVGETYKRASGALRARAVHREPMFEGARDLLARLHARPDIVMGVATGKSDRGVRAFFEAEALHAYFQTIQTADTAPSKPHPGMIHQAMRQVGALPRDTVMIGDTSFDIRMARNAGVAAVGVSWGYHRIDALQEAGAHAIVHGFDELEAVIDRLLQSGAAA